MSCDARNNQLTVFENSHSSDGSSSFDAIFPPSSSHGADLIGETARRQPGDDPEDKQSSTRRISSILSRSRCSSHASPSYAGSSQSTIRRVSREHSPASAQGQSSITTGTAGQSRVQPSVTRSGTVTKEERRATKRLEAERKETEKRMKKLEDAEAANGTQTLKRESRRLTKKQPLERSSRSSSVESNRSRSSSLTRLLSVSRRSRSRSNSKDRGEQNLSDSESAANEQSLKLPERFAAAVSRGLDIRNNASLSNNASTQSQESRSVTELTDLCDAVLSGVGEQTSETAHAENSDNAAGTKSDEHSKTEKKETSTVKNDLDRAAFSATLNRSRDELGKPVAGRPNTAWPLKDANAVNSRETSDPAWSSPNPAPRPHPTRQTSWNSANSDSTGSLTRGKSAAPIGTGSPPRLPPIKAVDGRYNGTYKRARSSPLAGEPVTNDSVDARLDVGKPTAPSESDRIIQRISALTATQYTPPSHIGLNQRSRSVGKPPGSSPVMAKRNRHRPGALSLDDATLVEESPAELSRDDNSYEQAVGLPYTAPRYYASNRSPGGHSPTDVRLPSRMGSSQSRPKPLSTQSDPTVPTIRMPRHRPALKSPVSSATPASSQPRRRSNASTHSSSHSSHSEDYETADESASSVTESSASAAPIHRPRLITGPSLKTVECRYPSYGVNSIPSPKAAGIESKESTDKPNSPRRGQVVAKAFSICCQCGLWHDLPRKTSMKTQSGSLPNGSSENGHGKPRSRTWWESISGSLSSQTPNGNGEPEHSDRPAMHCSGCAHPLSRGCCQEWTTIVHMHERRR